MDNGKQFPDDFLAQHGFSPTEQGESVNSAMRGADSDTLWSDSHHESFHEHLDAFKRHADLYKMTKDPKHKAKADNVMNDVQYHANGYLASTGKSLRASDGTCSHCGEELGL